MKIESPRPNHHGLGRLKPLALAMALASSAHAASPVAINNPGFEAPVTANGSFTSSATGWSNHNAAFEIGVINPDTGDFTAEAPEGVNLGYVYGGVEDAGLAQVLTATLLADSTYNLSVKVGNSISYAYDGYRIQLLAGGTLLAEDNNTLSPASDAFVTSTVNYVYNAGLHADLVGQPLEIRLLGKGLSGGNEGETEFDDVQLTVILGNPIANPGGPYTAFIGGSLLLDGSASLPSDGATITTYEWELDGDDDFNDATGANPAAITQADLFSIYGMEMGGNTIKLRVTDSAAKISTVETTVNIVPANAVVYEPFAYPGTVLNGAGGTSEVGLTGTWLANAASGLADNLPFGALVTRGGGVGNFGAGGNTFGGRRFVDASALAGNGLLNDGATLWFSVILGYDSGGNRTNTRLTMVLGDESMGTGNFQYFFPTAGSTGLGVTMGRVPDVNGRLVATQVRDSTFGTGFAGNVFGTLSPAVYPGSNANRDIKLVVGRITWGASSDTIDIFVPDTNLQVDLNAPHSTLTVNVNQSGYDTISFQRGDRVVWDEVRFGATYASVTETGSYWDTNGTTAGSGSAAPSGTWNTDPNWNGSLDGTGVTSPWAAGSTAVFSAGNDATDSYTVTVDGTQDIGGIIAEDGTVTVSGGTALRLTSNATVSVADGMTATISTPFTEDAAGRVLAKSGVGTAILSGDNSGVTGGMFLGGGAAQFESPASIAGTADDVVIATAGTAIFGPGFGSGNIPAALADRIVASSTGTIAVDSQLATNFDFNTPGLTAAYLGAVEDATYTGTLTPNGTTYRLGGGGGILTMGSINALTGANALLVRGRVVLGAANDFTGATTVPGDSSLRIMGATTTSGISVNQPAALLELGADGALGTGALTVNGGFGTPPTISAVGDSANTNAVTANGDFILAGTGTLSFGVVTPNGNRTITNNNTTGTTTFAGFNGTNRNFTLSGNGNTTVGDVTTGTGTLTKNGSGTLSLTGTNTNTGNTIVNNAGTLLVTGSTGTGAMTLNNTSTLAGNGNIGGNVTVTATANMAPGTSVGTLPITGDLTITAMAGSTGVIHMELGSIAASDKITVGGTLNIGAGTLGFTDFVFTNVGGLENGTYKLITSGAAVSGTLNADDLTGPIGPIENGVTGTIKISDDLEDIELLVDGVSGGSPYGTWSGGAAANIDSNGDGVLNGVAWALGAANPNTNAISLLPTLDNTSDPTYVRFIFNRSDVAEADSNTDITVQYGSDLEGWTTAVDDNDNIEIEVTEGSPTDAVVVKLKRSALAPDGMIFARLNVVVTP